MKQVAPRHWFGATDPRDGCARIDAAKELATARGKQPAGNGTWVAQLANFPKRSTGAITRTMQMAPAEVDRSGKALQRQILDAVWAAAGETTGYRIGSHDLLQGTDRSASAGSRRWRARRMA